MTADARQWVDGRLMRVMSGGAGSMHRIVKPSILHLAMQKRVVLATHLPSNCKMRNHFLRC